MKTKLFLVTFVSLVVVFPVLVNGAEKPVEAIVGQICAMTGPTSTTHIMNHLGTKEYLFYLNDKFGGIEGKKGKVKIKYLTYDSQYVVSKAKDGFAKFRDQGMIVFTQGGAAQSDGLIDDYESAKIPMVTPSHGVASMWSDWAYGTYHCGVANMIRNWMVWVKDKWIKAGKPGGTLILGTITTDEPYVPLSLWDIDPFSKEQGIKLVKETISRGTTDASPQLLRLKEAGAKEIFVISSAVGSVVVVKSAKAMGLNLPLTQCTATSIVDVMALGGAELCEGFQGEYYVEPPKKNPKLTDSAGMKLTKEIWAMNHSGGEVPKDIYVSGFTAGMVVAEGIRLALDDVSPEELRGESLKKYGLDRIKNFDCKGLTKPFSYTPDDHIGPKHVRYWVIRNGFVEPLSDWIPSILFRIPKPKK